jgi:hypothetical protein
MGLVDAIDVLGCMIVFVCLCFGVISLRCFVADIRKDSGVKTIRDKLELGIVSYWI